MGNGRLGIDGIDHLVLTTGDLAKCLDFYVSALGMRHEERNGRHSLHFGTVKINIHTSPGQFQPAAQTPTPGGLDLCLTTSTDLHDVLAALADSPYPPITGIVERTGARGPMQSIYLRDPDGNLIELAHYGK